MPLRTKEKRHRLGEETAMRRKRIGILGGTFNPPHFGHERCARKAGELYLLDKVVFIPCGEPPHRSTVNLAPKHQRLHMTLLATDHNPGLEVNDLEIHRPGPSYMVDTLRLLRKEYDKDTDLFFILGADAVSGIMSWRGCNNIFNLANFVVMPRHLNAISSTHIRDLRSKDQSIGSLTNMKVVAYIEANGLYR